MLLCSITQEVAKARQCTDSLSSTSANFSLKSKALMGAAAA